MANQSVLLRRTVLLLAVASVALGVALVVVDEQANKRNDATFAQGQVSLQTTFGVFDDAAASEPLQTEDQASALADDGTSPALPPVEAVALLTIPRINLAVAAASYNTYDDLRYAIGYMPESAAPNEPGITYFVGHRTGFGAPFRDLDQMQVGDMISVKNAAGKIVQYRVDFVEIRKPTDDLPELLQLTGASNILLVTCHPEFSTELRLIVGASDA